MSGIELNRSPARPKRLVTRLNGGTDTVQPERRSQANKQILSTTVDNICLNTILNPRCRPSA
jgi:hypothetical protein